MRGPPAISANLLGVRNVAKNATGAVGVKEPLFRVVLCDPITNEEAQELGYFRESFAEEFLAAYRRRTADDPDETLIALAFPVKFRELAA